MSAIRASSVKMAWIQTVAIQAFGLTHRMLTHSTKKQPIPTVRHIIWSFAYFSEGISPSEQSKYFLETTRKRYYDAINSAIKAHEDRHETDPEYRHSYEHFCAEYYKMEN